MDQISLYDADILTWSEHQAEALRRLAVRRDLPNDLDLENIAEEIESVGRGELRETKSFLRLILRHLVKIWADAGAEAVAHWDSEVRNWQLQLRDTISPAMRARIDLDRTWAEAVRQAQADLLVQRRAEPSSRIGTALDSRVCPIGLEMLCDPDFDVTRALSTLPP